MTTVVDYHAERSWHFLDLVDDEVERGELEEALQQDLGRGRPCYQSRRRAQRVVSWITQRPGRNRDALD